jgi:hypothetical protein
MRSFSFFLGLLVGLVSVQAQDVIRLKNGDEINAKVTEIGISEIKYKRFDYLEGPTVVIEKSEVFVIDFQNGTREVFATSNTNVPEITTPAAQPATQQNVNPNLPSVILSEYVQDRKDVIVRKDGYYGFRTAITRIDDKNIHYIQFKKNGKEKDKKIAQRKVAFTLQFDKKVLYEKYPEHMLLNDFLSLPTYNDFTVFGTVRSNLQQLGTTYPDITKKYAKGIRQKGISNVLTTVGSIIFVSFPILVAGIVIDSKGTKNINKSFTNYYNSCLDLDVCAKYGIIITPYNTTLTFK